MWPTPIYHKDFPDSNNLNKYLLKHIKEWRKTSPSVAKTNSGGGWHSPTDMNERPEYKPLLNHLFQMVDEIFKDYGMEPKVGLGNMWANINPPNAYNKYHIHPNSDFSGVYYVQVPKDSGNLWLEDPRPGANIQLPRRVPNLPQPLWRVTKIPPIEGRCIMFPAWVPHGVEENNTKAKGDKSLRVSVSFNFIQVPYDKKNLYE
jgi:uncharacterized protein (TIGR02466 family)